MFWRRHLPPLLLAVLAVFSRAPSTASAAEVQHHGVVFEQWIRDTFFDGYQPPGYTQKWDIPAEANREHGGLPVNPKAIKYGTPIGLGDALRQYDIDEPFILLLGYWQQEGPAKRFVKIVAARVEPAQWRALWGNVDRGDLERLDQVIKNRDADYRDVRRAAQAMKQRPPYDSSIIVLNPKIDSKGQRRLQCSLRFADFFAHLAPGLDPAPEATPALWGVPFPGLIESGAREFDRSEAGGDGEAEEP